MPLSASQIVSLALTAAKAPGYTSQGGQFLNVTLQDLAQVRNLKENRKTTTITILPNNNGPFALPADYLRMYDLFFLQNNLPYFLKPVGQKDYDAEFKDPSIANYPYEWATDLSLEAQVWSGGTQGNGTLLNAGNLFVYPQSSGSISLTMRYFPIRPDIVTPEISSQIPWYPNAPYLIKRTATWIMTLTDDERQARWEKECEDALRPELIMEGDEQEVVKQIQLDPRRFRMQRYLKPTKVTG